MNKRLWCFFVLLVLCVPVSGEQAEAVNGKPVTTADPEIPVDELDLRLRPLTQDEVRIEVDGWLGLLQDKVHEISITEIALSYSKAELALTDELEQALDALDKAQQAIDQQPSGEQTGAGPEQAQQAVTDPEQAVADLEQAERDIETLRKEAEALVQRSEADREVVEITRIAVEAGEQQEAADGAEEPAAQDEAEAGEDAAEQGGLRSQVEEAATARAESRQHLLDYLVVLRGQQTALVDRANSAIDDFERKGGKPEDVEKYRKYVGAVSAVEVDVSDALATWTMVTGWLVSEEGGLRWLKNIAMFVVIMLVAIFLARLISGALDKAMARTRQTSQLLSDFLVVTARRLVVVVGLLVGLAAMEINVGPVLAVIGAAGFVIAFALQDSLGNFASGILIMVFRPFDVGDIVEIGGKLGRVKSMNLLSVQINTMDNRSVIIPNNNVWSDSITNVTGTNTRRVDLVFGIAYDDDMEKAQHIMEQVVSENPMVLKDPEPVVRVHELGDSSVNFVCRPWVKTDDYWEAYWALTRAVKERFDREGISIPFPQRDVHVIAAGGDDNKAG